MKTLIIGLVFALIGAGLMAGYNTAHVTSKQQTIAYTTGSWKLDCSLTAGDRIVFLFLEHALWVSEDNATYSYYDLSDDNPPIAVLRVFIDITPISPAGDTTRWDYDLAIQNNTGTVPRLAGWAITQIQNGSIDTSPMLTVGTNVSDVGGIVPFSGTYEASLQVYPPRPTDQPPSFLGFYHNVTVTDHPYTDLLYVGGATVIFGGALSLLGASMVVSSQKRAKNRRTEVKGTRGRGLSTFAFFSSV